VLAEARHALITGAAGAIGAALAGEIARRAPGARLSLVDVDAGGLAAVCEKIGPRAKALRWDLSAPATLGDAYAAAAGDLPVDVLVNCAGVMELRSLAGTPWPLGARLLDIDLVSPMRLMSLAVPGMRERGRGVVINIASMAGLVPLRGSSYYGAAKAGLAMASEVARLELAPDGVRVVTVYPGPVASGLERRARAQVPETLSARIIPTGDPAALAAMIADAAAAGRGRVIYPRAYLAPAEMLGLARRLGGLLSPRPFD
jgi:3-hydroxybutyrate dehydrogenase